MQPAKECACAHLRLRTVTQIVADLSLKAWRECRVLDFASLEGIFALEIASHGAQIIANEGREASIARARFAAKSPGAIVVRPHVSRNAIFWSFVCRFVRHQDGSHVRIATQ